MAFEWHTAHAARSLEEQEGSLGGAPGSLDLSKTELGLEDVEAIQGYDHLRRLDLSHCRLDPGMVEALAGITQLQVLIVKQARGFDDRAVGAIVAGIPSLQELDASGDDGITDSGLAKIAGLTALNTLRIPWCIKIGDPGVVEGLRDLAGGLRLLDLEAVAGISDRSADTITRCSSLTWLNISGTGMTSSGLGTVLQGLPSLQHLGMGGTALDEAALVSLASTSLTFLDVSHCRDLSDSALQQLCVCQKLEVLHVEGCPYITFQVI